EEDVVVEPRARAVAILGDRLVVARGCHQLDEAEAAEAADRIEVPYRVPRRAALAGVLAVDRVALERAAQTDAAVRLDREVVGPVGGGADGRVVVGRPVRDEVDAAPGHQHDHAARAAAAAAGIAVGASLLAAAAVAAVGVDEAGALHHDATQRLDDEDA